MCPPKPPKIPEPEPAPPPAPPPSKTATSVATKGGKNATAKGSSDSTGLDVLRVNLSLPDGVGGGQNLNIPKG